MHHYKFFWLLFFLASPLCLGDEFNFGLGYIGLKTHHYRGSDETKIFNLYVPYVSYESEHFEAQNGLVNTYFLRSRFLSLKLSFGVNPAVESDSNKARKDMPELNYNFGIGPMAIFHLIKSEHFRLDIDTNIRRELETDFSLTRSFGVTRSTYISADFLGETWSSSISYGHTYADKGFHEYYYEVEQDYATADRPEYSARSGLSSKVLILTFKKRFGDFLFFPFYRQEDITDAVYADSPLVKQEKYEFFGLGIFYLFI